MYANLRKSRGLQTRFIAFGGNPNRKICGWGPRATGFSPVCAVRELQSAARMLRERCAFTLIEVIVVLVILAVAASIVIPYATSTSSFQASGAARLIMSDLEYAQNQAITTQSPVSVTFDVSGNSYTVSNESGTLIHPISKQVYVVDFDTTSGFKNVSVSSADFSGSTIVTFDALGAPDNNGAVVVAVGESFEAAEGVEMVVRRETMMVYHRGEPSRVVVREIE